MSEMEKDLIELSDESGNTAFYEVMDYFFYNGDEYVRLQKQMKEGDEQAADDAFEYMKVNKFEEDGEAMEEFEPIEDELVDALSEMFRAHLEDD